MVEVLRDLEKQNKNMVKEEYEKITINNLAH